TTIGRTIRSGTLSTSGASSARRCPTSRRSRPSTRRHDGRHPAPGPVHEARARRRRRSVAERVPVNRPESRYRRRQLEVTAEALEARLVGQPLVHEMEELLDGAITRLAEIDAALLPALAATDVDAHHAPLPRSGWTSLLCSVSLALLVLATLAASAA